MRPRPDTLLAPTPSGPVVWAAPTPAIIEGNEDKNLTFTVILSPSSPTEVTVDWATESGTAAPDADYRAVGGTITFASSSGIQTRTVAVPVLGDTASEGEEAFFLTLSNPRGGATVGTPRVKAAILNDDAEFSVDSPGIEEMDSGAMGELAFNVRLAHPVAHPVVLGYTLAGGTASLTGGDIDPLPVEEMVFRPGEMLKTLSVRVRGDDSIEGDETVMVEFQPRGNHPTFQGMAVIRDNDTYTLSIDSPTALEGEPGDATELVFTVTLAPPAQGTVTVDYGPDFGDAARDYDYQAFAPGTLAFRNGDSLKRILVTVFGDGNPEPDETVAITLSGASPNTVIKRATGRGTILDDDTEAAGDDRIFRGGSLARIIHAAAPDSGGLIPGHRTIRDTAGEAAVAHYNWNRDASVDGNGLPTADYGEIRQAINQATGTDIAAIALGTDIEPGDFGDPTWKEQLERHGGAAFVVMMDDDKALAFEAAKAGNGIVAAAVDSDKASGDALCGNRIGPDCVNVNMRRGANADAPLEHEYAAAKLAAYAALLQQAFEPRSGEELVEIIRDGANGYNVFSLARALERRGIPSIGNGKRYANAHETAGGVRTTETGFAIAGALAGRAGVMRLGAPGKPLGITAFRTFDRAEGPDLPAAQGFVVGFRNFRWGTVFERNRFLGKTKARMLGAGDGYWTWAGWSNSAGSGRWSAGIDIEAGVGRADAEGSAVVADYGTVYATSWALRADYNGRNWRLSARAHQPARTERARIRLRDGEGTVRESKGREIRFGLGIGIGDWTLDLARTIHPGHDRNAGPTGSALLRYAYAW